jgi:hypothetical protein
MPEGSKHASILIATSWQALNRAIMGRKDTLICDCTIVILFASFFVESNLNYIIEEMNLKREMSNFLGKKYPGIQDKLGWYYNEFIAGHKANNLKQLYSNGIERKLRRKFPGFAKLYRFRNDLSHGVINRSASSLEEALELRNQAKRIVSNLFSIASENGYEIPRVVTYGEAIESM